MRSDPDFTRSLALQQRLHELVPGGAHTYARGSDQYPEFMQPVLDRGEGARVWDVDGNCFIEYGSGLRAVTLGHGYRPVVEAVATQMRRGTCFSRPTALEARAAEEFLALVDGADMVKFAKNGSDTTTAAIKLARALTGRTSVAACRQPFFSVDDWFIGTTEMAAGIPDAGREHIWRFDYNDITSLRIVAEQCEGGLACVVMEAASAAAEPLPGYLQQVRALCDEIGALLIFDEIITGFRWSERGAQAVYGVRPDLSCWGKAMGNGFSVSALAGRREYMEAGGLATDRDRVFLLSTTHGAESTGLAAFLAVVEAYRREDPIGRMHQVGTALAEGVNRAAAAHHLQEFFRVAGRPTCAYFVTCGPDGHPSQAFRTLFLQEMLRGGVLGQSFVVSAAHTDQQIEATVAAADNALRVYARALEAGSVERFLEGRPVAPALRRRAEPRRLHRGPARGSA